MLQSGEILPNLVTHREIENREDRREEMASIVFST